MTGSHSLRWRTVGPHWCSIQRGISSPSIDPSLATTTTTTATTSSSAISSMQRGIHSSYLNAISSRPDHLYEQQQQQHQQHNLKNTLNMNDHHHQQHLQQQQQNNSFNNTNNNNQTTVSASLLTKDLCPSPVLREEGSCHAAAVNPMHECSSVCTQPYPSTIQDSINFTSAHVQVQQQQPQFQLQQQLQQQQLQQQYETQTNLPTNHKGQHEKLHTAPGGLTRPWFPTFGPANLPSTCSDRTIALTNPLQYTTTSHPRLYKQSVGPHWRSIPSSNTTSPTGTPPPLSPTFSSSVKGIVGKKEDHHQHHHRNTFVEQTTITSQPSMSLFLEKSSSASPQNQPLNNGFGRDATIANNFFDNANNEKRQFIPLLQHQQRAYDDDVNQQTLQSSNLQRGLLGREGYSYKRSMKRKAACQDEEMVSGSPYSSSSIDSNVSSSTIVPSIQRVSNATTTFDQDSYQSTEMEDQEMECETVVEESVQGQMNVDVSTTSSVNQEDYKEERVERRGIGGKGRGKGDYLWSTFDDGTKIISKRSKPRLELVAIEDGMLIDIDGKIQDVGQREMDIFQQCFYNAAATLR